MWAIPTGASWLLKKKNQVKSPSTESHVPETGSDPPIGSDRDSGCDNLPRDSRSAFSFDCPLPIGVMFLPSFPFVGVMLFPSPV